VKIANKRNDYLHKLSTNISKSHVVICLEDLKVQNMTRSAKGTQEKPGKNVAATQANFNCIGCNYVSNADVNAAKNILAAGRAVIAFGDIGQDTA
jgi:transposase